MKKAIIFGTLLLVLFITSFCALLTNGEARGIFIALATIDVIISALLTVYYGLEK